MRLPKSFTTVTPLSKTLAFILFIALPFAGFYLGMEYQKRTTVIDNATVTSTSDTITNPKYLDQTSMLFAIINRTLKTNLSTTETDYNFIEFPEVVKARTLDLSKYKSAVPKIKTALINFGLKIDNSQTEQGSDWKEVYKSPALVCHLLGSNSPHTVKLPDGSSATSSSYLTLFCANR